MKPIVIAGLLGLGLALSGGFAAAGGPKASTKPGATSSKAKAKGAAAAPQASRPSAKPAAKAGVARPRRVSRSRPGASPPLTAGLVGPTTITEMWPPEQLPAEAIPQPTSYQLTFAGLDGADAAQYTPWVAIVRGKKGAHVHTAMTLPETAPAPHHAMAVGGVDPYAVAAFRDPAPFLLVTALVREDASFAQRIQDLEQYVATAVQSANDDQLDLYGSKPRHSQIAAQMGLDVTPGLSLLVTWVNANDLHQAYSVPAQTKAGMQYKLAVPHAVDRRKIDLLLNLPGTLPPRTRVDLAFSDLDFSTALNTDKREYALRFELCIKGECVTTTLPVDQLTGGDFKVRRYVLAGMTKVSIRAFVASRPRSCKKTVHGTLETCPSNKCTCSWMSKPGTSSTWWRNVDLSVNSADDAGVISYNTGSLKSVKTIEAVFSPKAGSSVRLTATMIP